MNTLLIKMFLYIWRWVLITIAVLAFMWAGYSYLESDRGLLSDETLISIISDDVLGDPVYGKSCLRSAYKDNVESRLGGDRSSGYFIFNPVVGQEINCPSIAIITNRRTAEAWIADPPK
jgi:hypothetical protein